MTRQDAAKLKLRRYSTGKPCRYGHKSDRFTLDGSCVECRRLTSEKQRLFYKDALAGV